MFLHEDMIQHVKLFELGDPAFMLAIIRHLKPRLYMSGDYIIRRGEHPSEMFFIRKGRVVVYATDEMTEIAYLDEGSFFGEIGILFGQNRSVSVRSITASLISTITDKEFKTILKSFPEYRKFIKKIAI